MDTVGLLLDVEQLRQRITELEAALADKPAPQYVCAGDITAFAWMRQCRAAEARVAELEAIVAKLPKTADGVAVWPPLHVWSLDGVECEVATDWWCYTLNEDGCADEESEAWHTVSECYSTREAAEAKGSP